MARTAALVYRAGERSRGYIGGLNHQAVFMCNRGVRTLAMKGGEYFLGKVGAAVFLVGALIRA